MQAPGCCGPQEFREAMAQFPSGVAIVTTAGPAGQWGLTASAVCSVSDDPPTVLVCVNRSSRANPMIRENRAVAINLLAANQSHLAARFASKTAQDVQAEFLGPHWLAPAGEPPVLCNAAAWLRGRLAEPIEVASHTVFIVAIDRLQCGAGHLPAVYHRRSFAALQLSSNHHARSTS